MFKLHYERFYSLEAATDRPQIAKFLKSLRNVKAINLVEINDSWSLYPSVVTNLRAIMKIFSSFRSVENCKLTSKNVAIIENRDLSTLMISLGSIRALKTFEFDLVWHSLTTAMFNSFLAGLKQLRSLANLRLKIHGVSLFKEQEFSNISKVLFGMESLKTLSIKIESTTKMSEDVLWNFGKELAHIKLESINLDLSLKDQSTFAYIYLFKCVPNINSLKSFHFSFGDPYQQMNNIAISKIAEAIPQMTNLQSFGLSMPSSRTVSPWQLKILSQGLSQMKNLVTLNLAIDIENEIDYLESMKSFSESLINLEKVKQLTFEPFKVKSFEPHVKILASAFSQMKSLNKLHYSVLNERSVFNFCESIDDKFLRRTKINIKHSNQIYTTNDTKKSSFSIQEETLKDVRELAFYLSPKSLDSFMDLVKLRSQSSKLSHVRDLTLKWDSWSTLEGLTYIQEGILNMKLENLSLWFNQESISQGELSSLEGILKNLNYISQLSFVWKGMNFGIFSPEIYDEFVKSFCGLNNLKGLIMKVPINDNSPLLQKILNSITKLANLESLELDFHKTLYNFNRYMADLFENFASLSQLKEFKFRIYRLDEDNLAILSQTLSVLNSLITVELEIESGLDIYTLVFLYKTLSKNKSLRKLKIQKGTSAFEFPSIALEELSEAFANMENIESLFMNFLGFQLTSSGLVTFTKGLTNLRNLNTLEIELTGDRSVSIRDLKFIIDSLEELKTLKTLSFKLTNCSSLTRQDVEEFQEKLSSGLKLENLKLNIEHLRLNSSTREIAFLERAIRAGVYFPFNELLSHSPEHSYGDSYDLAYDGISDESFY